eukprot:1181167-Prorocentrum_minimum.AAC.4
MSKFRVCNKPLNVKNITSFYGSSCANTGKDALNTPESLPPFSPPCPVPHFLPLLSPLALNRGTLLWQGALFWSAPKRFPKVLDFDVADPVHLQFVRAAANLKAEVHGLARPSVSDAELGAMVAAVKVDPFTPKAGVTIETDPKASGPPPLSHSENSTRGPPVAITARVLSLDEDALNNRSSNNSYYFVLRVLLCQ